LCSVEQSKQAQKLLEPKIVISNGLRGSFGRKKMKPSLFASKKNLKCNGKIAHFVAAAAAAAGKAAQTCILAFRA
jgi:hypothetical protein